MKKILIINDDSSIREICQLYLELKGFEIFQASDGYKGLEQASQILPDLILLDVMMPGINGYEVCKKLKQDEKTKEIPVIFLSSLLNTNDKIKGLECGAVDFITNTADQAEILARVETQLKLSALNQEIMANNQELRVKQEALNDNLKAAVEIQQSLLPINFPSIPNVDVVWFCQPSQFVGGDICNIVKIDNEHIIFYVLDVSGHGVSSAMVTVAYSQYLQQQNQTLESFLPPKQMLRALNKEYPFERFNIFATIFFMVFNSQNGELTYSNAGHPAPVHLSLNKKFQLLNDAGAIIGVSPNFPYEEHTVTLLPGDKVILYTDGVTEARNSEDKLYGSERFYALLESIKNQPLKEIIPSIMNSLKEFAGQRALEDDVSLMGIEFKPEPIL